MRCAESGRVSYRRTPSNVLALDIDPAAATNSGELEEYQVGNLHYSLNYMHIMLDEPDECQVGNPALAQMHHHRQGALRSVLRVVVADCLIHQSQDKINAGQLLMLHISLCYLDIMH